MSKETKFVSVGLKHGMAGFHHFNFVDTDKRMSWHRWQRGTAELDVTMNANRKWVEFNVVESFVSEKGRTVSKEVFVTLEEAEARQLFAQMKKVFEA